MGIPAILTTDRAVRFVANTAVAGGATPHDTNNDGKDRFGFGLSGASYTDSTKTINATNAFTNYEWSDGDAIALTGGTGITQGLYEIASRTDASNIVLKTSAGSDASDLASSSGPFLTVGAGVAALADETELRICDDGTYTATDGASGAPFVIAEYMVKILGCDARGVPYVGGDGVATIDGTDVVDSGVISGVFLQDVSTAANHAPGLYSCIKIINAGVPDALAGFTHNTSAAFTGNGADSDHVLYLFCEAEDSHKNGFTAGGNGYGGYFMNCRATGNTRYGFYSGNVSYSIHPRTYSRCVAASNGLAGFAFGLRYAADMLDHCLSYNNTGAGVQVGATTHPGIACITNCTFYNNSEGIEVLTSSIDPLGLVVRDCIFKDNTNSAIDLEAGTGAPFDGLMMEMNNIYHNNGSAGNVHIRTEDATDKDALWMDSSSTIVDPNFVSVTAGSEDFTPQATGALGTGVFLIPRR